MNVKNNNHSSSYSIDGFWSKIVRAVKKAGKDLIIKALILYYALQDPDTPAWAKAVIVGALSYLISPLDLIPDFKPVVGYADDAMVLAKAAAIVAMHVKDRHIDDAYAQWDRMFG